MDKVNGMSTYPDNYFDLCFTDPPFGIDYQSSRRIGNKKYKKIQNDKTPFLEWIPLMFQKMKIGGRLICFYRWDVAPDFIAALKAAGFNVIQELIWDKVKHGMGDLKACPAPQHEKMLYATKGRYEFTGKRPKTVYRHVSVYADFSIHPNEKPVNLFKAFFRDFANKGDVFIDPFAGSGASILAADSLGFDYVGFEIDKDYYNAAKNRISKGIQKSLF